MVVAVGESMTEVHIRDLPVLRDPLVYFHSLGLCSGRHSIGCGGEQYGRGCVFVLDGVCAGLSQWLVVM